MTLKPSWIFDRDREWRALTSWVDHRSPGPALGVVSGRRRQGKTYLLAALSQAYGGFYFAADDATEVESLRRFGDALADFSGVPVQFGTWDDAVKFMISLAAASPVPLVLDEFPLLVNASPALPSILQRHLDAGQLPTAKAGRARLLLCGSALSVMGKLLAGQAPLRGRAGLELVIKQLGYRDAARFWQVTDPRTAILLHSVVGGTPAYRRQFVGDDAPAGADDFDGWVCRTVLNPAVPLLREARYLLAEDVDAREPGLYQSVLGAIANGNATNGGIASYVGRKSAEIAHPLNVLGDSGLIIRDPDVFRGGRSTYRIAEPLITFYQAVMRPNWTALELGGGEQVWRQTKSRFLSQVVGPHFEQLCRDWLATAEGALPCSPAVTGSGVIPGTRPGDRIQLDVVALGPAWPGEKRQVLSLGEAKWGKRLGPRHLQRLSQARDALAAKGYDISTASLDLYSGTGFDDSLAEAASTSASIRLVGPDRLYS